MEYTNDIISLATQLGLNVPETGYDYEKLSAIADQVGMSNYSYTPQGNEELYNTLQNVAQQQGVSGNTPSAGYTQSGGEEVGYTAQSNDVTGENSNKAAETEDKKQQAIDDDLNKQLDNNNFKKSVDKNTDSLDNPSKKLKKNQYDPKSNKKPGKGLDKKVTDKAGDAAKDGVKKAAGDTAKNAVKDGAGTAAKKGAKNAAENATKAAVKKKASGTTIAALFKNPYFWIVVVLIAIVLIVLFLILVIFFESNNKKRYGTGEFPYAEIEFDEQIKIVQGDTTTYVDIDDYVAGVVAKESGEFTASPEELKAQAIAARTYALYHMEHDHYIGNSSNSQNYDPDPKYTEEDNIFHQAAVETRGIVLAEKSGDSYKFINSQYDALAIDESCGGGEDDKYFILCQKQLKIPVDWPRNNGLPEGDLNFYRSHFHGQGMSQWGAFYLAMESGYDYKQILKYFYDDAELVSLYPPQVLANVDITETSSDSTQLIHETVTDYLASQGTSINLVNDGLRDAVLSAGPGTRAGVVTAAVYLLNTFEQYGVRLPYQMGGGWGGNCSFDCNTSNYYGINPNWGASVDDYDAKYNSLGMDCASFVTWAFHTGGLTYPSGDIKQFGYLEDEHVEYHKVQDTDEYIGQPGDFIWHSGHVMLILDYYNDGDSEGYYIAAASGYANDILIYKQSINSLANEEKQNYIGDMSYHYKNSVVSDYKTAFDDGRLD